MIKAKDLRIGDLVKLNESCFLTEKGTIGKVADIYSLRQCGNKKGVVTLEFTEGYARSQNVWCRNIDPIPLTPEILKKNGWKKRTEGWYFMMISKYMYLSVEFGYENGIRVFLKRTTGLYVKLNIANNVHELQHILWALGKDANLKI